MAETKNLNNTVRNMNSTMKALVLAMVLTPMVGQAQLFDTGASAAKQNAPWKGLISKKGTMKLDFRNANVDMVLNLFQSKSGVTIVKDPTLTQPITLTTAKALSIDQAFEVLRTALDLRGFQMAKQGDFLVIKPKEGSGRGGSGASIFGQSPIQMPQQNQTELRVYPLKFASSNAVAKLVNDVFNDAGGGASPFGGLQFGNAGGAAQRIRQQLAQAMGGQKTAVRAASDDFSNSVIVNATSNDQRQISDFLKQIDKQNTAVVSSRVYKLQYASATDVTTVVNNVLQSNQPQGRGAGLTGQQNQGGGGFFANIFGRGQQSQVAADTRSNSVVVTTTDDIHLVVKQVIEELDKPIQLQNTTFVFPLGNARADQVANLLNQAFGSRQGSNVNFNAFNRNGTTTGNAANRNTNTTGNTRPAQLGGEKIDPNSLDLALADPSKDNGELLTSTSVSQGFFTQFGGGGNQNRNQTNGQQTGGIGVGRDSQGKIVNTRDLTGQVTIIPDINTNSIIVVANPDAVDLIKNILDQLDRTPEQVMIETIIVEASLSAEDKLGVEWNLTQAKAFGKNNVTGNLSSNFGLGGTASTLPGFKYTIAGGNLSALVNALATDSKFEILSTPRIFTSNNMQAVINVSQSVPYVVSQQTNTNGVTNFNYSFLDVGIVLTVTPRITANGMVTLDITQTANDLQGFTTFNAPIVNQREAQTTVSVLDGETAVLGGIMRTTVSSTVNKIPILGDIPILGNLFRSTDKTKQKTELLVFLSPHVVRTPEDARALTNINKNEMTSASQKAVEEAIKLHNATNGEKPAEKKP